MIYEVKLVNGVKTLVPASGQVSTDEVTSGNMQSVTSNAVSKAMSYLTEEQFTGKYWIDGKSIYRKVVNFGVLPNNTTKTVAHSITNLDKIIDLKGIAIQENSGTTYPLPYTSVANITSSISLNVNSGNIAIRTGQDRTSFTTTYVTLEYTKTTD